MPARSRALVYLLFLVSGATGLVYQVAWTRDLSLIFGASYQAIAIVLAAFMAGLALGGVSFGRRPPGGMPPGQYKKYSPDQGVGILSEILRRHGYSVVRTSSRGDSRYVYYRTSGGTLRRATVAPGSDRLNVSNLPNPIMREMLSKIQ